MDFKEFFEPVDVGTFAPNVVYEENQLGSVLHVHTSENSIDISELGDLAIIGIGEERGSHNNIGCKDGPNQIRKELYQLFKPSYPFKITDLGNIRPGNEVFDTYFALAEVVSELIKNDIVPIIVGGSKDLTYANYLAYNNIRKTVNLVAIDAKINMHNSNEKVLSDNYLSKTILHQPNILFNFSNIGYQSYLVNADEINLIRELNFNAHRLGQIRSNITYAEPVVRNADFVSFDISSIRHSEAPGHNHTNPNGFFGHEACQLTRYAGMSDKLTSIGFYEYNPQFDTQAQTAKLMAQMIWYFADGFYNRKGDFPKCSKKDYKKFVVPVKNGESEIVFYKSHKTDRWWMEHPISSSKRNFFSEDLLTPCNYSDYETATKNEIPDSWLKTFNKLH